MTCGTFKFRKPFSGRIIALFRLSYLTPGLMAAGVTEVINDKEQDNEEEKGKEKEKEKNGSNKKGGKKKDNDNATNGRRK